MKLLDKELASILALFNVPTIPLIAIKGEEQKVKNKHNDRGKTCYRTIYTGGNVIRKGERVICDRFVGGIILTRQDVTGETKYTYSYDYEYNGMYYTRKDEEERISLWIEDKSKIKGLEGFFGNGEGTYYYEEMENLDTGVIYSRNLKRYEDTEIWTIGNISYKIKRECRGIVSITFERKNDENSHEVIESITYIWTNGNLSNIEIKDGDEERIEPVETLTAEQRTKIETVFFGFEQISGEKPITIVDENYFQKLSLRVEQLYEGLDKSRIQLKSVDYEQVLTLLEQSEKKTENSDNIKE